MSVQHLVGVRLGVLAVSVGLAVLPNQRASATDGYFQNGYGMKSIGMGGTSYALSAGGMNGANNPASASFAPSQLDLGLYLFMPDRSSSRSGNAYGLNGMSHSGGSIFAIPEIGLLYHVDDKISVGVTVYGNGGLSTAYSNTPIPAGLCGPNASNLLCGSGKLGVSLNQMIVAPTLSYKVTSNFSLAIAPQFMVQQFAADGLQAFTALAGAQSGKVTNRGFDYSYGAGVRVGAFWVASPLITLGATYQTEISATKFNKYQGLFAGTMDVPANLGLGIALHLTPELTLAADYERIFYGDVNAVGNSSLSTTPQLGVANGLGFGWKSINVFKAGISYMVSPSWTLRAGYNYSENPVKAQNVTFNILTPAVVQHHASLGATYQWNAKTQLTIAYSHAFSQTLTGPTNPLLPGGGQDKIRLAEDEIGLAVAFHF